jgi:hypothetical protein
MIYLKKVEINIQLGNVRKQAENNNEQANERDAHVAASASVAARFLDFALVFLELEILV